MCTFIKELWPLSPVRISYQLNILRINDVNLIKFCICIDIDKQYWMGIVMHKLVQFITELWSLNHVRIFYAPYYENE